MSQTIVLITGTNRGLGRALVERFLALPNHTIIAANRNTEDAGSKSLTELPKGANSSVILTKYDAGSEQSAFDVVKELREKHGIEYLDIVFPNAAIAKVFPYIREVKRAEIAEHVEINVLSVITLFQATRDLLQKSTKQPIFAPMGSSAGYIKKQPDVPSGAYGVTKVMLYWYGARLNAEEEWLNVFVVDPGFVQTDMGNGAARRWGMEEAPLTVDESINGVFNVLRTATKEKYGGKAVLHTGEVVEV